MTSKQLSQVKSFAKKFYKNTDPFHDWHHIDLTVKYAKMLSRDYPESDPAILEAACLLHDIGRITKDEGHPEESAKLARPFLEKIKLDKEEIDIILDAVSHHTVERILDSKTIEAKLLFDADKLQILTIYGFLRVSLFLAYKRKWGGEKIVKFMWEYIKSTKEYMQTKKARKLIDQDFKLLEEVIDRFYTGFKGDQI